MIYGLALFAALIVGLIGWRWRKTAARRKPASVMQATVTPEEPKPEVEQEFAFAQFNDSRRKYAADIDAEAQRLVRKLEIVREAMSEDIAALKRMRAEADAAKAEAALMRQEKRDAEQNLEEERAQLRVVIEAHEQAVQRIDELNDAIHARDGDIVFSRDAMLALETEYQKLVESSAVRQQELAQHGLDLNQAQQRVASLEQALFERDEEFAVQARQIENLRAETAARRDQIELLEHKIAKLIERFDEARLESLMLIGKLRDGQQQAIERADKLENDSHTLRRHTVETERARDRLLGQVGQLRAENAGLRAESQVKMRDLETMNNELSANIAVLERMLANTRSVRAQPAPARAHLRLIAEAKKVPGRAVGT